MYLSFLVFPIKVKSQVAFSLPVGGNCVATFQDGHQVLGVFLAQIFYAKIINAQGEAYWSPFVSPENWRELTL